MPYIAPATAIPKKINRGRSRVITLNLDLHDLLHDAVADQLQGHGRAQHDLAHVVGEKELDVVRVGVEHQDCNRYRNTAKGGGGHFSVGADRANASAQLEAFANHVGQIVQNFRQV